MSTAVTPDIRKTVLVDAPPEQAFALFTEGIATWWPTQTHSYAGDKVETVVFEGRPGGAVYEVTAEGRAQWGRVVEWEPPHRFRLEWLIGDACGSEVTVTFAPEGPGSRIELVHGGFAEPGSRAGYEGGWDVVLAPLVERARA